MSVGTNLVTAKAAVISVLSANAALTSAGVQISYEPPERPTDLRSSTGAYESIHLGDASASEEIPVLTAGALHRDEALALTVHIQVLKPTKGGTQQQADTRAAELLTEVQRTFANDVALSSSALRSAVVTGWKHFVGHLPNGNGHGSRFEVTLEVESRLTPS